MSLLKTSFYTTISTAVRIISSLIVVKLIAVYVGPDGLGKMGQLMSVMSMLIVLSGGTINNGIIKYVSEYRDNFLQINKILSTAFSFSLATSSSLAVFMLIFSYPLSCWLLQTDHYVKIIWLLAVTQFGIAGHNFLISILNGFKEIKATATINIIGTVMGLFIILPLLYFYGLQGAFVALILSQAILVFISLWFSMKQYWFTAEIFKFTFEKSEWLKFGHYSLMAATSAMCGPIAQILIRNNLASIFDWTEVGYWQAVTRISDVYLLFATSILTVYYLPRLSEINHRKDLYKEILNSYKIVLPFIIVIAVSIFVARDLIIELLFTKQFSQMHNLFTFQLIGDVLKIGGWVLGLTVISKAMTLKFIVAEVMSSISLIIVSYFFTTYFGLIGVTYAFALNSAFYWLCMYFCLKTYSV